MEYKKTCKVYLIKTLKIIFIFMLLSFFLRCFANSSKSLFSHYSAVIKTGICLSFVFYVWSYNIKTVKAYTLFSLPFVLTPILKMMTRMTVNGKEIYLPVTGEEIVDVLCFSILICSLILLVLRLAVWLKNGFLKALVFLITDVFIAVALVLPVFYIGYYFLSRKIITPTIILSLFQTNIPEAIGYLKGQNYLLWGSAILVVLLYIVSVPLYFNKIQTDSCYTSKKCNNSKIIGSIVLAIILTGMGYKTYLNVVNNVQVISIIQQTKGALNEWREYSKAKDMRKQKLEGLIGLSIKPGHGGLYVLVIGESETRDHMQAYGYAKNNTPWLTGTVKLGQSVLFSNSYSNHCVTNAALPLALSGKNQYNKLNLPDAFSIIEVAKAAGYKTLWISNQLKFGAADTPVTVMSSTVDHEIWLNGNLGNSTLTQFYDEEIVQELSSLKINKDDNLLIICHLMGCHSYYPDRYPEKFEKYKLTDIQPEKTISAYDNSVLYNDYVLQKIYECVKNKDSFKAMVYLSDHGEEPDQMKHHDPDKFTWQMVRIPLVMLFSKSFINTSNNVYQTLINNKDVYWTNDLLYDVLINIMGIQNAPDYSAELDIASDKYNMNINNLKTMHGQQRIIK